jgi:hypothetical protein
MAINRSVSLSLRACTRDRAFGRALVHPSFRQYFVSWRFVSSRNPVLFSSFFFLVLFCSFLCSPVCPSARPPTREPAATPRRLRRTLQVSRRAARLSLSTPTTRAHSPQPTSLARGPRSRLGSFRREPSLAFFLPSSASFFLSQRQYISFLRRRSSLPARSHNFALRRVRVCVGDLHTVARIAFGCTRIGIRWLRLRALNTRSRAAGTQAWSRPHSPQTASSVRPYVRRAVPRLRCTCRAGSTTSRLTLFWGLCD